MLILYFSGAQLMPIYIAPNNLYSYVECKQCKKHALAVKFIFYEIRKNIKKLFSFKQSILNPYIKHLLAYRAHIQIFKNQNNAFSVWNMGYEIIDMDTNEFETFLLKWRRASRLLQWIEYPFRLLFFVLSIFIIVSFFPHSFNGRFVRSLGLHYKFP